jgi:hypothetical protein
VQNARGVGADLDAGADLAHLSCLLIDMHIEAGPQQRQRCGGATDAAADNDNGYVSHRSTNSCSVAR